MFYRGRLFKHKNNTDVAFEVNKLFFVKEKRVYKLHVTWWNIGICHDPMEMNITQKIEIPFDKAKDWIDIGGTGYEESIR